MTITFNGMQATVSMLTSEGKNYYKIEWPDHTLDFLYFKDGWWCSATILSQDEINQLAELIQSQLN
jgi:hypothetical protein